GGCPYRAAISVPDRGNRGPRRRLSRARRGRLGARRAPEPGAVALDPPPPRGVPGGQAAALHRPAVAREPVRGLSDRASDRAGPDRAQRAVLLAPAVPRGVVRLAREPRTVLPRLPRHPAPLPGRQPAPDVEHGQRRAEDADPRSHPEAPHRAILPDPRRGGGGAFVRDGLRFRGEMGSEQEDFMAVDTSMFAQVIQDHLDLKRRNAALEHEMPLGKYLTDDPFENHPLFKT